MIASCASLLFSLAFFSFDKVQGYIGLTNQLKQAFSLAPQNPVVNFDLPIRLDGWFPRQRVRQKREDIRRLILELHQSQNEES